MSGDVEMVVTGGDAIAASLDRLSKAGQREFKKAAKKATREGLKPLHAAAKAGVPVETGRLRKAVKLRAWRRPKQGEVGMKVFIDPGDNRADPRGAYYGSMVESGHIAGGTYVPGRHFLRRAAAAHGQAAQATLSAALSKAADDVIRGKA